MGTVLTATTMFVVKENGEEFDGARQARRLKAVARFARFACYDIQSMGNTNSTHLSHFEQDDYVFCRCWW